MIESTDNRSWRVTQDLAPFFTGPRLGEYIIATSGMTIGNNALFLREVRNGSIEEPYQFEFTERPISLAAWWAPISATPWA